MKSAVFPCGRLIALLSIVLGSSLFAYPPAPFYTVQGVVKNALGDRLRADQAEVILLKGNEIVRRAPLITNRLTGDNYRLQLPMDQQLTSQNYDFSAHGQGDATIIAVEVQGQRLYPIEVTGGLSAGKPGDVLQLDLTLGEDTDGDGIPDLWEQWQLTNAGLDPNDPDNLSKFGSGDYDKDGLRDRDEYIAGTFANDAAHTIELTVDSTDDGDFADFVAVNGRVYFIECSTDLSSWHQIDFAAAGSQMGPSHSSPTITPVRVQLDTPSDAANLYFRLSVK